VSKHNSSKEEESLYKLYHFNYFDKYNQEGVQKFDKKGQCHIIKIYIKMYKYVNDK